MLGRGVRRLRAAGGLPFPGRFAIIDSFTSRKECKLMSRNAVFLFSVWTSLLSAVFYFLYGFTAFGVPWVMFVCLAIFFGMGGHVRDVPAMCLSALAGCVWGKVDFLLMDLFQNLGLGLVAASFVSITLGTAVTMVLHIHVLARTPFRHMPFIFAGVCLTFSQNNGNTVGLAATLVIGIVLAALCSLGMEFAVKQFPLPKEGERS